MVVIGEQTVPAVLAHEEQSWIDRVANDALEKTHPLAEEDDGRVGRRSDAPALVPAEVELGPLL